MASIDASSTWKRQTKGAAANPGVFVYFLDGHGLFEIGHCIKNGAVKYREKQKMARSARLKTKEGKKRVESEDLSHSAGQIKTYFTMDPRFRWTPHYENHVKEEPNTEEQIRLANTKEK